MNALLPIFSDNWLWHREPTGASLVDSFFKDFGRPVVSDWEKEWAPAIDVSETENEYIVKAELPGINKKDIDISLTDGVLTVKGEKKLEKKEEKENYHYMETRYGTFTRSLKLPEDASAEKVDATYADGVLTVTVPKTETAKPRKIEVQ
ncbi:MAG: Hsp20/alpha crystallin family protein [Thermodesulfobacteriota bacterium]